MSENAIPQNEVAGPRFPDTLTRIARTLWETWSQFWPPPTDEQGNFINQSWDCMPEELRAQYRTMARRAAEELGVVIDD